MVLCHACVKIVRITEGFGPPESAHGGGHGAQVHVFQRKSMVLYPPGTKIVDFVMENGPHRGAALQLDLG